SSTATSSPRPRLPRPSSGKSEASAAAGPGGDGTPGRRRPIRRLPRMEISDEGGVVRRAFAAPFGVVDPCRVEPGGQVSVDGDQVEAHAEVAGVADPVVPPGEAAGPPAPSGHVD